MQQHCVLDIPYKGYVSTFCGFGEVVFVGPNGDQVRGNSTSDTYWLRHAWVMAKAEIDKRNVEEQCEKLQALKESSLAWWESQRPVGWELRQHLDNPAVNTATSQEQRLAEAVASAVECGAI